MQALRIVVGCVFLFIGVSVYEAYLEMDPVDEAIAYVCVIIGLGAFIKAEAVGSAKDAIKQHEKKKHIDDLGDSTTKDRRKK